MSKFAGIFDEPKQVKRAARPRKGKGATAKKEQRKKAAVKSNRGRPAGPAGGKRSDPRFVQITAYVLKDKLPKAKAKLAEEGRELSDLVQEAIDRLLRG